MSIESVPQGLEAYYQDHWRRMEMTDKERKRSKSKIVYVIAELRQPMPRREIGDKHLLVTQKCDRTYNQRKCDRGFIDVGALALTTRENAIALTTRRQKRYP